MAAGEYHAVPVDEEGKSPTSPGARATRRRQQLELEERESRPFPWAEDAWSRKAFALANILQEKMQVLFKFEGTQKDIPFLVVQFWLY